MAVFVYLSFVVAALLVSMAGTVVRDGCNSSRDVSVIPPSHKKQMFVRRSKVKH